MSFTEKVDVLDFMIATLQAHEKALDEAIATLTTLLEIVRTEVKADADNR